MAERRVGRPRLDINMDDVEFLRCQRFTWSRIAEIIGVSRASLYHRLEEEGISPSMTYSDLTDQQLDDLIRQIKIDHPHDGERLMIGHLTSRGITVTRTRLRASIHRVDPFNTAIRRSVVVRRRTYHASGPNAVWHIDGNHKLIRWRLVVHAGIDGYSRTVVYLTGSDNNRADTVLEAFLGAVERNGLPSQVRTDLGGENIDVWRYMMEQHQSESAVITGSSTHNERVERLWRDVTRSVGSVFYDTFRCLEDNGQLNPLNEVDIYCLHWVYKPRLNSCLQQFVQSWNNHSVSTENSQTPNQLFIEGILAQQQPGAHPIQPSRLSPPVAGDRVRVPASRFRACSALRVTLQNFSYPVSFTHDHGMSMYSNVVNIVGAHLMSGCNLCMHS